MPPDHYDVFLSYHWRDHAQVEALAERLRELKLTVFLDRWYLTPGQSWPKALKSAIAQCKAVAVCIGQGEMGPWQQREQYLALERQVAAERRGQSFPVIPVLLPGAEPPLGFLSQNTWVDFRERSDPGPAQHACQRHSRSAAGPGCARHGQQDARHHLPLPGSALFP
jgi:hypothetical protein